MAAEITLNLGKQWLAQNSASAHTFYAGLVHGRAVNTADATTYVIATNAVGTIGEITGTGYARQSFAMGASDTTGVMVCPSITWSVGSAADWPTDVSGWFMATASVSGTAVFVWDLGVRAGTTTSGSKVVTGLSVTTVDLAVGGKVWGPGVQAGTSISTVDSATQVTMSASATASATVNLSFSRNASTNAQIVTPALNFFYKNPGE